MNPSVVRSCTPEPEIGESQRGTVTSLRNGCSGIRFRVPLIALALTPIVFLVNGYHPFADDGAIYVAEIRRLLDPQLYPHNAAFVLASSSDSIFTHVLALVVSATRLPLAGLLLGCQLLSIFLFLLAAGRVADRLFARSSARWGALLAVACSFTLPVAGTALFVMDPYVTPRSFSTPINLLAVAACFEGGLWSTAFWLLLSALVHPLMAAYALVLVVMLRIALASSGRQRAIRMAAFGLTGFLVSAAIFIATLHVSPNLASSQAALSRSYFFLVSWHWYEYLGLVFPLLLLLAGALRGQGRPGAAAGAMFAVGLTALMIALCFVHPSGSFFLARLQPLRAYHILYAVGLLLGGGWMGSRLERFRHGKAWIAAVLCAGVLSAMFAAQRLTYGASAPVEWPWSQPRNRWEQAFLWIRRNTPQTAMFALDARYIEYPGEDSQGFRAIAERSMLADWYKDGGIASEFPVAQAVWRREVPATEGLNEATDEQRIRRLRPLGATWLVLPAQSETRFRCPYQNSEVRVCRIPE